MSSKNATAAKEHHLASLQLDPAPYISDDLQIFTHPTHGAILAVYEEIDSEPVEMLWYPLVDNAVKAAKKILSAWKRRQRTMKTKKTRR